MKARRRNWLAPLFCTGVFLLTGNALTQAQQPAPSPGSSPSPSQAQSAPPNDLGAQIDELIRQCNEQMNVKGQFKEAKESAQQALDLSQKLGDKNRILRAMLYLGSALFYTGRTPEALETMQRAAALAREIGNRKGLSRALNNIAGMLGELGRFEESLSYLYQSMDVARELGDQPMQYTVLINIGELYLRLGDPEKAEAPLMESLRIGRELKHSDMVSNPSKVAAEGSLQLLGEMEAAREHYPLALNYFQQVRDSHPDSQQTVIMLLDDMAVIHQRLGEPQKAVQLLTEAMGMAEKAGSISYWSIVANLGEGQESLGQFNEALASENRALEAVRHGGGNPDYEWQIERRIGHIERSLGDKEEALTHYQNAAHGIERLRALALNTELGQASFVSRSRAVYAETADLLVDLHREYEALEVAERGRARAFLDMLARSRTGLAEELTSEQRKREDEILARISASQKSLWKENISADEERKLKAELISAEDDLETFHVEVRHSNPRYASIQYPEPVNVSRMENDLLDAQSVLVEFLLGEKRSLVWAVSKEKLSVGVLPPRKEIEDEVSAYRKALTEKVSALTLTGSLTQIERTGKKLYSSLLQPVENALAGARSLVIVPDGTLGYLPFETLILPNRHGASDEGRPTYLLEKFSIVYGPSASALATLKGMNREQAEPPKTLLAFGDPTFDTPAGRTKNGAAASRSLSPELDSKPEATVSQEYAERGFSFSRLPYTRAEVLGISKLYPANKRQVYLGEQAREETVKAENLEDYRYIHFASHGFVDEIHPSRSGILFSRDSKSTEDGVLQMGEIMRLKMNADLVTLSACSTGLGKLVNGEGILGLTRAFFYAGARNVTVSLWNVNDSSTSALMKAFYENLNRGLSKSAALRQAKLTLLRGKEAAWRHPYYWAAFVLVGEGK
jgi:CHAT domain-containing protein